MSNDATLQPGRVFHTPDHKLLALTLLKPEQRLARAVELLLSSRTLTADDQARWSALTGSSEITPKVLLELADQVKRSAAYVDLDAEPYDRDTAPRRI